MKNTDEEFINNNTERLSTEILKWLCGLASKLKL